MSVLPHPNKGFQKYMISKLKTKIVKNRQKSSNCLKNLGCIAYSVLGVRQKNLFGSPGGKL